MFLNVPIFLLLLLLQLTASSEDNFIFNGFTGTNLSLDGVASVTPNGLLRLTNNTHKMKGHAFYPVPFHLRSSSDGNTFSFSTTFIFAMIPQYPAFGGSGLAFLLSPSRDLSTALPRQYLGLFNSNNNGNSSNHILAIELDTIQNDELQDIDFNHVGIDINSVRSNTSHTAGYFKDATGEFKNLSLISGEPMQVWVYYDSGSMQLNVTLGPVNMPMPKRPLLSSTVNLSGVILDLMYIGFSSSTGMVFTSHYILGWSFRINGTAQAINFSKLPRVPKTSDHEGNSPKTLLIWLPLSASAFVLVTTGVIMFIARRRIKYAELLEDWELEYGPRRFSYKDLFAATRGFKDKELLGTGGFGKVYKGVLPTSKIEVAIKRVSHESRQGVREFIAEIVSIGRLQHRNLVQLLGYCRRKGELLLVYDYMPNGSLDKFLHDRAKPALDWAQRFLIIKGVASGLLYLHEEWEQVVIHRDIKASNVLLDSEMNGRLGDFGLARLYDHGSDPQTTHIVGTRGYLAPELVRTGRPTKAIDVFAFGAFLLEMACGRRPIEPSAQEEELMLVDWVFKNWWTGAILETIDPRLGTDYVANELELVLKLGLLCSYPLPSARPSMRQVVQYLDGEAPVPDLVPTSSNFSMLALPQSEGFDGINSYPSSLMTSSVLSGGR